MLDRLVFWRRAAPAPDVGGGLSPPGRLIAATPFARVQSSDAELTQLGLLRFITGLVCFARFAPIVWASVHYFDPRAGGTVSDVTITGAWLLALIIAGAIGLASPLVLPLLMVACAGYDDLVDTQTLGTTLLNLLWGLFFLAGAGARCSLDSWLLRRPHAGSRAIRALYRIVGTPPIDQLRQIYLLYFVAYSLMNLSAVAYHVDDDAWRSGTLLRDILTDSYLSSGWASFRDLDVAAPALLSTLSAAGSFGQMVFQTFMLPLLFTRWGSRFVIGWGAAFFGLSLVLLQLSYLPLLEIVLWTALFHRPGAARTATVVHWRSGPAGRVVWSAGTAFLLLFAVYELPYSMFRLGTRHEVIDQSMKRIGLEVPRVFNNDDLRIGDAWPVIYREPHDTPLPYHGLHGERLSWVRWNDLFYFGNSLRWRRNYEGPSGLDSEDNFAHLTAVARFDHRRAAAVASRFRVEYYALDAPDPRSPSRFNRRLIGVDYIECRGAAADAMCQRVTN